MCWSRDKKKNGSLVMGRMTITLDISIYTILTVSGIFILLKGCVIFWGIALASNNLSKLAKIVDNLGLRQSKCV